VNSNGHRRALTALVDEDAADETAFLDPGLTVVRASDVQAERVLWLWPGRMPRGKLIGLNGDPAVGKSTVMLDVAARVTTAAPMPDGARVERPESVVLLTAEDGLDDTVRPRLDAAGADASRVFVVTGVEDVLDDTRPPAIPDDVPKLERLVERERATLVIVDVLNAYLSQRVNSYRDQDVRRALHPLAAMAERTGAAVVVVRHLSKAGGANPLYRAGGSIGMTAAFRAEMLVAPDPDDATRRILAVAKLNLAAKPPALAYRLTPDPERDCARVEWEGTTEHTAEQLLLDVDDETRAPIDDAAAFLTELLADGPIPAKDAQRAADDAGITRATLRRAKARLGIRSMKVGQPGEPGEWRWAAPTSSPAVEDAEGAHP
jgi:AAA domain